MMSFLLAPGTLTEEPPSTPPQGKDGQDVIALPGRAGLE